jgi:hypothetical protein
MLKMATAAGKAGNHAEATRQYCRGITYMMSELKRQPPKKGGDSSITY